MFGSMLGWIMTCSYVGSRIPQLVKNYRRGMTTGLSLPMFVLLVLGSATYVASIFVRSVFCWMQIACIGLFLLFCIAAGLPACVLLTCCGCFFPVPAM